MGPSQKDDVMIPLTRQQTEELVRQEMANPKSYLYKHPDQLSYDYPIPTPAKGPRPDPRFPMPMVDPVMEREFAKSGGSTMPSTQAGTRAGLSSLFGGPNFVPQAAIQALTPQSTVPSSSSSVTNPNANAELATQLMKEFTAPIDTEILRAGLTPTSAGTATGIVPPSLTRPVTPFQDRPFNRERVVGAGNARARGIANAITGVTNAVGHVVSAEKQKDQDKLSVSMQRLLTSQQAINQANQFLSDPNIDPARKKSLQDSVERNQKVMNVILDDKKTRGDIEKGLNISFTDPSKNATDQHGAVQAGIKSFREQFEEQMPQQLGPDPLAQMRMEEAIRMQQSGQRMLQSVIPRILGAKNSMELAQFNQHAQDMRAAGNHMFEAWKLGQQFANNKDLASLRHTYRLDEIGSQIQQMGQKAMELFQLEKLDPVALFDTQQKFFTEMAGIESKITGAQGATITAIAQLGAALNKNTDSATRKIITDQIQQMTDFQKNLDLQMQELQKFKGRYNNVITNLQKASAGQAPASGGQSGTGTGATASPTGSPSGSAFDPSTLLFGVPFRSGGALPPTDGSDDTDDTEQEDSATP